MQTQDAATSAGLVSDPTALALWRGRREEFESATPAQRIAMLRSRATHIHRQPWRTFVVLGDGELQEGSNWEAAMYAAQRGLGNLTAIVDRNRLQQGASTADTNDLEPLADKWTAFGWETCVIDGHSHEHLLGMLSRAPGDRPRAVIADT